MGRLNISIGLVIGLMLAWLPSNGHSAASSLRLLPINELSVETLRKKEIAVVELEAEGTEPVLTLVRITRKSSKTSNYKYSRIKHRISFKNYKDGLYYFQLASGTYQITQIEAPYFNFPFRLQTKKNSTFRFKVSKDRTNYIGKLVIKKERSEDDIDVEWINRFATRYKALQTTISPEILEKYPLQSAHSHRDDFYTIYQNSYLNGVPKQDSKGQAVEGKQ